eukprot:15333161-Alexandrium_andersonii.AAC.1
MHVAAAPTPLMPLPEPMLAATPADTSTRRKSKSFDGPSPQAGPAAWPTPAAEAVRADAVLPGSKHLADAGLP